jgi:hypothetical protein
MDDLTLIDAFIKGLKTKLLVSPKSYVCDGDNPWANGDTETGFYPDKVFDYQALCDDIDAFAATFKHERALR